MISAVVSVVGFVFAVLAFFVGRQLGKAGLGAQLQKAENEIELQKQLHAQKLEQVQQAQEQLQDRFRELSELALKSNNEQFLTLAKTQFERLVEHAQKDLGQRQEKIDDLVKPVHESLQKVGERIHEIEKSRTKSESIITEQIKSLSQTHQDLRTETSSLVAALRAPQTRGQWGEMQLKRCVEMAGMLEYCDFKTQETQKVKDEDARLRPDMLVRLPGNKLIVIDAKTPLASYLDALQENDPVKKKEKYLEHAKHIRKHIDQLSRKAYWSQFQPTPEFVVLFLPGESFFSAALEQDPGLIEAGVTQNVIISTPTTLIALLRAVAYGWQQEKLQDNIRHVAELGRDLYKRLSDMTGHFSRLGKSLTASVDAYNRTVGSLENRVLVTARKMNETKMISSKQPITELEGVDTLPRSFNAPELEAPQDA